MSVAPQPVVTLAPAPNQTPSKTKVRFGIILDLNGTLVPVSTDDIANVKTKGIEFTLQQPVSLPDFNTFSGWVSTKFGVQIPKGDDLPPPLNTVIKDLETLVVTIETLHIKIPASGAGAGGAGVQLTVEANAIFGTPVDLIPGVLGIQGFVFGFSKEPLPQANPAAA